ncbi:hypothetical protein ACFPRL_24325 [Pseudoclavibacter helvolus]
MAAQRLALPDRRARACAPGLHRECFPRGTRGAPPAPAGCSRGGKHGHGRRRRFRSRLQCLVISPRHREGLRRALGERGAVHRGRRRPRSRSLGGPAAADAAESEADPRRSRPCLLECSRPRQNGQARADARRPCA